jgi:hypothetical protein
VGGSAPDQGPRCRPPDPVPGPGSGRWPADEAAGPHLAPAHRGGDG